MRLRASARPEWHVRGGLTRRMAIASGLLTLVVVAGFIAVLLAIDNLRDSTQSRRDIRQELVAANALQTLVIDLETGLRGYRPRTGRSLPRDLGRRARRLSRRRPGRWSGLVAGEPVQLARIRQIEQDVASYVRDYSLPLVRRGAPERPLGAQPRGDPGGESSHRRDPRGVHRVPGQRRRDARSTRAQRRQRRVASRSSAPAVGAAGSILLILLFAGYLTRVIVRPIRQDGADGRPARRRRPERPHAGDRRRRDRRPRAFVQRHGGLAREGPGRARPARRGAGGVAAGRDARGARGAAGRAVRGGHRGGRAAASRRTRAHGPLRVRRHGDRRRRLEQERAITSPPAIGCSLGGKNLITMVAQTGRPARMDSYAEGSGPIGVAARETGDPLGGRDADHRRGPPLGRDGRRLDLGAAPARRHEARLADFTDLVATAIANAESRADLAASRARIVATADETRRRIERDLHDGAQQRLVSLALELRAAQAAVPPELGELEDELSRVAEGLASVMDELREIARGIHPAILAEGGLGPALKTLARRSPIPVELDVRAEARLPERVEVATYYVVSETLTNAAKHAHASVVHVDVEALDGVASRLRPRRRRRRGRPGARLRPRRTEGPRRGPRRGDHRQEPPRRGDVRAGRAPAQRLTEAATTPSGPSSVDGRA